MSQTIPPANPVQHFSTRGVPQDKRFDSWMSVMSQSLWQVTDWREVPRDFNVDLCSASLGCVSTIAERISPHHSRRTKADVERSQESSYHLFVSLAHPWSVSHRGRAERMAPGDIVMIGDGEHETLIPLGFDGIILKCREDWLKTWMPDPDAIVGRAISRESRWGRVLCPMISSMTPALAAAPPLPADVLVDQLGVMLSMVASDSEALAASDLLERILDCIRQRCAEAQLTAADVARSLELPAAVLHRALRSGHATFASSLLAARVDVALSLLASPAGGRLGTEEIARRAGFSSAAYFSRVMRRRTGRTMPAPRGDAC